MRGMKAKILRREAYGDLSLRAPRQYAVRTHGGAKGGYVINHPSTPRAVYQRLKAAAGC